MCKITKKDKHTFTFFKQDTKKGLKHVYLNNNSNKINIIFYATNEEKA